MPHNIKSIITLKAFTNISNKNTEVGKMQIYGEFKWDFLIKIRVFVYRPVVGEEK
jgi:hypothetical protein